MVNVTVTLGNVAVTLGNVAVTLRNVIATLSIPAATLLGVTGRSDGVEPSCAEETRMHRVVRYEDNAVHSTCFLANERQILRWADHPIGQIGSMSSPLSNF